VQKIAVGYEQLLDTHCNNCNKVHHCRIAEARRLLGIMAPRIPTIYVLLALGLITFFLYYRNITAVPLEPSAFVDAVQHDAANETLGFGAIYVVSGPNSPRQEGLIESANVTELHLTITRLPAWTEEQIVDFRDKDHPEKSTIVDGSIKAWLSHNVILHEFLKSGAETALIMEDDVDWDIRLRTKQVPRAAAGMRALMPPAEGQYYWGHPDDWELLYLGHCGDYFTTVDGHQVGVGVVHPEDLDQVAHVLYKDDTMADPSDVHPFTASLLTAFNVPAKMRMVHRSRFPLCTFGYAITRSTARKLIDELAPAKEGPGRWKHAYDIAILEACRDRGLRCYTVNPELLHHMEGTSLIDGETDSAGRPPADRAGAPQVLYRNETSNINCGFWSQDFRWHGDKQKLQYLREEVGRKGRCLKPGREDDGSRKATTPEWSV